MLDLENFAAACRRIRESSPVIHNVTNYVAMNVSANALLAVGASPLMSSEPDEMPEIANVSNALVVNTGCLERRQAEAMYAVCGAVAESGKPWVLDPAGVGLSRFRIDTVSELVRVFRPSAIRGNASEIIALAGALGVSTAAPLLVSGDCSSDGPGPGTSRGLDSSFDVEAATDAASALSDLSGAVVAVSGVTDFITDGNAVARLAGGHPLMSRVTAMGCTASALIAPFLTVCPDAFEAVVFAMTMMDIAGETAAEKADGPGSFAVHFTDALATTAATVPRTFPALKVEFSENIPDGLR